MEKNKKKSLINNKSVICFKNCIKENQINEIYITIGVLFKFYFPELFQWLPKRITLKIWKLRKFQE